MKCETIIVDLEFLTHSIFSLPSNWIVRQNGDEADINNDNNNSSNNNNNTKTVIKKQLIIVTKRFRCKSPRQNG